MAAIHQLFNKTYTVNRVALVSDGQGGFTQSYVSQSNVPGYMSAGGGYRGPERVRAMGREAIVTNVFYCDYNADIKNNDQLTNGGQTWNVINIAEPGNQDSHIEVRCEEVVVGNG